MRVSHSRYHRNYPDAVERFWSKVVAGSGGCWVWVGCRMANGYGKIGVFGCDMLAHRLSYMLHRGSIPDGLHIDHLCRNRRCVNPDHLEAVTPAENTRRGDLSKTPLVHCKRGHDMAVTRKVRKSGKSAGETYCYACALEKQRIASRKRWAKKNATA